MSEIGRGRADSARPLSMGANCLTIAGSDSGGGAGIQADLKTFASFGCYGTSVITALTAQNTRGVSSVHAPPPGFVAEQIDAVLSDIGAGAVKTGMLHDARIIAVVAERLRAHGVEQLVVDPVMVSTTGARLLVGEPRAQEEPDEAVLAMTEMLLPMATVVTPNLEEAAALVGALPSSEDEAVEAARRILDLGPRWVVIKGGHFSGAEAVDLVVGPRGSVERLVAERIRTTSTHGTGCSFAAALCACLATGLTVSESAREAKRWLTEAIRRAFPVGEGLGPVNHFHHWW